MATDDGGAGQGSLLSRALASEWIPPGLFFIALGAAAFWISRDYPLGELNRMGPGFFPRMLSIGISDCPPASSLALSSRASSATASASVSGSW